MQNYDDFDTEVDKETEKILKEYLVPFPPDEEVDKAVSCAESYIHKKRAFNPERIKRLLYNTLLGFKLFPKSFFVLSIVIYVLGYLFIAQTRFVYSMFVFVAPVPMMLSLINIFRGKYQNVWEVESVCKILPQELAVAKIFIVAVFNTLLNIALSIFLFETVKGIIFWKITMLWLVPMVLTGAITLFVCTRFKSIYAVPSTLATWFVAMAGFSYLLESSKFIENMSFSRCVAYLIVGIAIFVLAILKLNQHYSFERGTNYGTDSGKPFKAI